MGSNIARDSQGDGATRSDDVGSAQTREQASGIEHAIRRAYRRPAIRRLGSVAELTLNGSGSTNQDLLFSTTTKNQS